MIQICDVSSFQSTVTSNHSLEVLDFHTEYFDGPSDDDPFNVKLATDSLLRETMNFIEDYTMRIKIFKFQLDSVAREEMCKLQGIDYFEGSVYSDFDACILPNVFELI